MRPQPETRLQSNVRFFLDPLQDVRGPKIEAEVVSHVTSVIFQLAEHAVRRELFAAIPTRIGRLRRACD